jgi:uncharacterized membrane protein
MLRKRLVFVSVIALSACSPGEPSLSDSALASDLRILGTEPFWAIDIAKTTNSATYSRAGEADVALSFPKESKGQDGATVLTSTSSQGDVVTTLRKKDCSDGMSDRTYPWAAEVVFKDETLKGCAATPEFLQQTPQ